MKLLVEGLNQKTASVELREQLAVGLSDLVSRSNELRLRYGLDEIVLLSTCNRVEIYATPGRLQFDRTGSLLQLLSAEPRDLSSHTYVYEGMEAMRHLFRVAAGLDSMVFGETEITGQVKKAYEMAHGAQLTNSILNRVFQSTFQVVKEIRTRTGIGRGATSVGSVAAELAARIFTHDPSKQSVMIVGAGQMGEACVRHLAKKGARSILVANRSLDRAIQLAGEFGGRAVRFEDSLTAMAGADIVVASTAGPKPWLHRADLESVMVARRNRPLFLIDISVPRNIDAAVHEVDNVYLYNIDDLNAIVSQNVLNRKQELALCNRIIDDRAAALMEKLNFRKEPNERGLQFQSSWVSEDMVVASV